MKFAIKDFFNKCNQVRIWPHLLKKFLMESFISCAVKLKFSVKYFTRKCDQKQYCIKSYFTLSFIYQLKVSVTVIQHCVKSICIQSFSGPYFPAFGPEKLRIRTFFTQCKSIDCYVMTILLFNCSRFTPILYYRYR